MSQKITPYWIGNVAHMPMPQRPLYTGPEDAPPYYGSTPMQEPSAKVLPLIPASKEDAPKP